MTATGPASLIKAQIATNLQALVTAGDLGAYIEREINVDVLNEIFPAYPCAVLATSNMDPTSWEFPQSNRRTYGFDILIVQLQDNLTALDTMENLRDAIALQFDNNVTLAGTAPLGVQAVYSGKMTYADKNRNYILFSVTIKATTLVSLTYNF